MQQYLDLLDDVLSAPVRGDRTGTGTHSVFGRQMRFINIDKQFPIVTTKKVAFRLISAELEWMLRGETNIKFLLQRNCHIWNDWPFKKWYTENRKKGDPRFEELTPESRQAFMKTFTHMILHDEDFAVRWGDCGPVYGFQWRKWYGRHQFMHDDDPIDQIATLLYDLKRTPESRRMIVSAWNVGDLEAMIPSGLPPCHMFMQFYTRPLTMRQRMDRSSKYSHVDETWIADASIDGKNRTKLDEEGIPERFLDCQVYIRSNDLFLGAPYNISQYALLTHLVAKTVNMVPGELVVTIGDAHIYLNHVEQVKEQLKRKPHALPSLNIKAWHPDPKDYVHGIDFFLENYVSEDAIKAEIAV